MPTIKIHYFSDDLPRLQKTEKGDRICQFRIYEVQPPITFEACETLSGTDRGGFGSTGVK